MAAPVTQVTQIPLLHIQQDYYNGAFVPAIGVNTVAHGMVDANGVAIAPTRVFVITDGGIQVISAKSHTVTDVVFTATSVLPVTIWAF